MSGQTIDYENLAKEAMRSVVRSVLRQIKEHGLPGEHHFYISFHTQAKDVKISSRISAQYPKEMTIVLQHQFWDLKVEDDYFEVRLSFSNIPELLVIPYSAVKVFFDPSVPYGLQFDHTTRPEAVEDKSDYIEDSWNLPAENGDLPLSDQAIHEMNKFTSGETNDAFSGTHDGEDTLIFPLGEMPDRGEFDDELAPDHEISKPNQSNIINDDAEDNTDDDPDSPSDGAEVVSLDAFRKNK